jgi:mRNA-degrading endonuclease RelE of RelBE toxin-antitoxin system
MRSYLTPRFLRLYADVPAHIQKAFDQKLKFLLQNLRHPSLRAKKYDEARAIWQARVNGGWRFYFSIEGDTYILHSIRPHPK